MPPPGPPEEDRVSILLVDDQPANLGALEATLESTGCRFVLAKSADEALLALLHEDFAAIVLDIRMPGMSGFELASMIKRRQRTRQVPILFLTARMLDQQDELRGYSVGAVDYLTKPLDPQILRAKIAVFIELFRKRRALSRLNMELQRQIGERQRMSDALQRANAELEQRVSERTAALAEAARRKDEFIATLAHELRNPLSALRTATEALRLKCPDNVDVSALQGVFDRQVRQLTRLTNDLLDISRITRDKLTLQRTRVAVREIIDSAMDTVRPLIEKHGQSVNVAVPPEPICVDGDSARLSQVVGNLLDNASRYSSDGARIELTVTISGPHVLITVADKGAGIDRELLARIFEPFVQGRETRRTSDDGGLGIGLALARRLTELHGGSLTAYSAGRGRGSEFVVQLPILGPSPDQSKANTTAAASARPLPPLPRQRVLIIEDNRDTAAMMDMMLKEWGQHTRVVHDGNAALDIANEFQPQVVLLDVGLPNLHGYEVARRLRQQSWAQGTFIVAITGWGLEHDRHSEAAGIDVRMLKPVDPDVLRKLLGKRA
ncbi:MAG TPA: response regulator [Gemmatimonadales bacterium]|nr:response regulator [Gemmatimonadales bacterium]